MVDAKARQKEREEQEQETKKRNSNGFDSIFQEACEDLQTKGSISYHTTGYTKAAMSFNDNYKKRDYL